MRPSTSTCTDVRHEVLEQTLIVSDRKDPEVRAFLADGVDAGGEAIFIGRKVKVTSGKAGATLVTLDGEDVGPLGAGVVTREFAAQN